MTEKPPVLPSLTQDTTQLRTVAGQPLMCTPRLLKVHRCNLICANLQPHLHTRLHAYCWLSCGDQGRGLSLLTKCTMEPRSLTRSHTGYTEPTPPFSSLYLWPVKNDISSWRASISICILLEAQRFRAEDISALSRQN